ncbi:hypothetical protein IE978_16710 [Klebsiella pneumoniae]|uniref:Uncharacterized protein n=1 Tax=Klebsiella pneumoniae TaxID=573 RepID=A0A927E0U5_KLEPN|nr:hypothetical protein [Klebsiella pneumoniae]
MLNENNLVRRAHQTINLRDAALARQTRRGEHAVLHIHDHHYPLSRHCSLPRTFSQTVIIRAGEKAGIRKRKKVFFTHRYLFLQECRESRFVLRHFVV